ncbi:MAG: lysophospholipid acyltransferase family protein [Candidatus Dormibacteria bacterium]
MLIPFPLLAGLIRLIARVYLGQRFRVEGLENVPRSGPLLVVANHVGAVDPPLIGAFLGREMYFVAKRELFNNAVKRYLCESFHAFPIERHSADRAAIRRSLEVLGAGMALVLFPEGTRVQDAKLHEAEPGVGFLVLHSGAQVLPIGFAGTENCLPRGAWFPRRVDISMRIGAPFRVARTDAAGRRVTSRAAADRVMQAVAELVPESYRGAYAEVTA